MKQTIFITGFAMFMLVAISTSACGNSASTSEEKAPAVMNHENMNHDGNAAHSGQDKMADTPAHAKSDAPTKNGFSGMPAPGTKAFCPVMENEFEVQPNSTYSVYKGKTYVFCCPGCKPTFEADPEKYIKKL